jgi:hypothetical protein
MERGKSPLTSTSATICLVDLTAAYPDHPGRAARVLVGAEPVARLPR